MTKIYSLMLVLLAATTCCLHGTNAEATLEEADALVYKEMKELMDYLSRDDQDRNFKFSWELEEEEEEKAMGEQHQSQKKRKETERVLVEEEDSQKQALPDNEDLELREVPGQRMMTQNAPVLNAPFKIKGHTYANLEFRVSNMGPHEIMFVDCLYESQQQTRNACGRDLCVSISPTSNPSRFVRVRGDGATLALEPLDANNDPQGFHKDASFCLRPGLRLKEWVSELSLESVAHPEHYAAPAAASGPWVLQESSELEHDEWAQFRMDTGGVPQCSQPEDCGSAIEWRCGDEGMCYPRKNEGELCDNLWQCKSRKCMKGLVGNFFAGQWVNMCGYDPNVPEEETM